MRRFRNLGPGPVGACLLYVCGAGKISKTISKLKHRLHKSKGAPFEGAVGWAPPTHGPVVLPCGPVMLYLTQCAIRLALPSELPNLWECVSSLWTKDCHIGRFAPTPTPHTTGPHAECTIPTPMRCTYPNHTNTVVVEMTIVPTQLPISSLCARFAFPCTKNAAPHRWHCSCTHRVGRGFGVPGLSDCRSSPQCSTNPVLRGWATDGLPVGR